MLIASAWVPWRQAGVVTRTELLRAEDARGRGPLGLRPLIEGLRIPELRRIAIRGIGRQERPELVQYLIPYLSDGPVSAVVAEAMAQSLAALPPDSARTPEQRALLDNVFRLLRDRARSDRNGSNRGALARSIGRLPYGSVEQARMADSVLLTLDDNVDQAGNSGLAIEGVAHGLYSLARARRVLGPLSAPAVQWLRQVAQLPNAGSAELGQRAAWLALNANGTSVAADISRAISGSRDPQVRRLAVAALPNVSDSAFHRAELARVATDPDAMVRLEWVRVFRQLVASVDCAPLLTALEDSVHHVRLAAIDALGGPCPDRNVVAITLRQIIEQSPPAASLRIGNRVSWHARAHALASLARVDSAAARPLLDRDSRHPVWQVRMYVARGALAARDTALLTRLAYDSVGNVREAAIQGLSSTLGHLADPVYVRALASKDYQVVLAAARALRGAPVPDSVRPALVGALTRISREQRQTSRDVRMELLARIREVGDRNSAASLSPLLNDVDAAIATEAGEVYTHLTGNPAPRVVGRRDDRVVTPPAGTIRVRVKMADSTGGGTFDVLLNADEAPMTAARVISLIRRRYYDGLTFHRVVPNFVLQGGSPAMNEYVGDGPFMRDELGLSHHARGTVGISTRGRDTGDAQWFINLVDNYRLDHEYTVFATIVSGMDVVDRILEGDVIASVRVVP
jgi:cyclophilin family peptidyl-prolyl cis-trans isomerase/HEAT repeat protein